MTKYKSATAFAPGSVANVGCGYDIMGFAITGIGDKVTVSFQPDDKDSVVVLTGAYGNLIPADWNKNTASVAVDAYLKATGNTKVKLKIELEKNMPLGSGMGSSASSSAAAVVAVNHLFGNPLSTKELIPFAMEGERVACGSAHADNVAPSLLGGFVLIRNNNPLDVISVKCPDDLFCTVVHPHIELKTSDSRRILKTDISISDAIKHSANTAGFMVALIKEDYHLLNRSMQDLLAEPKRTQLIPEFEAIKNTALQNGAIGCGISGSGPSVFALCKGMDAANKIATEIQAVFSQAGLQSDAFVSTLNAPGTSVINAL